MEAIMKKEVFTVTGMTCSACSSHVEKTVSKMPGVEAAEVSLLANTMTVQYDEGRVSQDDIVRAVEKSGYGRRPGRANPRRASKRRAKT